MSLVAKGRGTVIATSEGQESKRVRIDDCGWVGTEGSFNLPNAGDLMDFSYAEDVDPTEFTEDVPDSIQEEMNAYSNSTVSSSNQGLGNLTHIYFTEEGVVIPHHTIYKAKGTIYRDSNGQDYFRVSDARDSAAVQYDPASSSPVQYAFSSMDNIMDDSPGRDLIENVTYDPEYVYRVTFDARNQSFDADDWAWFQKDIDQ